jgi:microcystin-dependent protein
MVFVLGLDNFYAIVVPKNLSGDYAKPSDLADTDPVIARLVKVGSSSVQFSVVCQISANDLGYAVALAEFDKDADYTGIDAGNLLYLQFIINLADGNQIIYPEPPQRIVVVRPSWTEAGEPPPTAGEPAYVISLRADTNPELFGRITLRSGTWISLSEDVAAKTITINATLPTHTHPLSQIEQSGAQTNQVPKWTGTDWRPGFVDWSEIINKPPVDWSDIVNKPDEYPPGPHASTHYAGGTDPIIGDLDANARVEVDKGGVFVGKRRKLNFIEGNNVFLQISDDGTNERINILLNSLDTFHLPPEDWQSPVAHQFINMGFFPWRTGESVSYMALYDGNNVTSLLTDNNDSTYVRVYRDGSGNYHSISCSINPRAVYSVRFKVVSVSRAGVVDIRAVDYRGNSVALWGGASSSISVSSTGWYEVTLRSETGVSDIIIISNASNPADVNIAEVEIIGGLSLWGWFVASQWGAIGYYNEGIIRTTVYLSKNSTYKFAAWFGTMGSQQYMKVEGRLLDEQGIVSVFRSLSPIGTSSEDQLVMISGDLITPPLSKFYDIEWRLVSDHRSLYGSPFYIYFLGMSIYSGENPAPATIGHTHSLSDITQSAASDKQVPKWNAQYQRWEAAYVDWTEIANRPQYFPAQPHTHDAVDIVSNRFAFARMPTSADANRFLVVRTANSDPIYDTIKSSDLPALLDSNARVSVQRGGTLIGTRRTINFIAGSGISISASDDTANERVNITITNTGGGGGGGGSSEHNLLDGSVHPDTAATTVARGMVIVGRQQSDLSIKWQGLALGNSGTVLKSNGADAVWDNVDWTEVQNKPPTFPPSSHTHSAADITSGRLSTSRLPTSSTANRFLVVRTANSDPTYDVIQASDLPTHTHTKSQITDLETITTTPTENAVPKADTSGKIALGWIPQGSGSNLDADTLDGLDSTAFERVANKGVANGYAPLDANAKLPTTHIADNLRIATIGLTVGDGVNAITTGFKGAIPVPFAGTITAWTVVSTDANPPTSGSIEIDILKSTYANYPTMSSMVGTGTKPNISNSNKGTGTPTGWSTTTINAGDIIGFNVTSVTGLKRITIVLKVVKS